MRTLVLLAAALATLPACRPAGDAAKSGEAMAEAGAMVEGPTGKSGDPVAAEAENAFAPAAASLKDGPPRPTNIPEQFRGRWGLNAADCEGGAAAKGLLTINDSRLTFYESKGTLDRIDAWTPANLFTANYGFAGEGMTWERVVTLERTGPRLRRTEQGGAEGPVDLTYTACPG
jgi:hypothetical protein